jgi:hypothetical protein
MTGSMGSRALWSLRSSSGTIRKRGASAANIPDGCSATDDPCGRLGRAWGQIYGVINRAIADRFNRTYPPQRQTAENLVKFARCIRAAKSEWREVARTIGRARGGAKQSIRRRGPNEQAGRARK